MIERLFRENTPQWEVFIENFMTRNRNIVIRNENSVATLHEFNMALTHLHDEVCPYYYRARAYKDTLEKLIDRTIKSATGDNLKNESARRSHGINLCTNFEVNGYSYNLYDYLDHWNYLESLLESLMKSIKFKADAKITNNSLLNIERSLIR